MQIYQEIRKDHEKQKMLMAILVETTGNSESRKEHFQELKHAIEVHESMERKHFYQPLLERKKAKATSQNAIYDHHEIDEKLEELENIEMSSPAWLPKMRELKALIEEHISVEERLLFDKADDVLTDKEALDLGADYAENKKKIA